MVVDLNNDFKQFLIFLNTVSEFVESISDNNMSFVRPLHFSQSNVWTFDTSLKFKYGVWGVFWLELNPGIFYCIHMILLYSHVESFVWKILLLIN